MDEALRELVDDETPEYRVVKATARDALRMAVEEAARRVRDTDEVQAGGFMGSMYAQLGDAAATRAACAEAVEAMLADAGPQAKGGGR